MLRGNVYCCLLLDNLLPKRTAVGLLADDKGVAVYVRPSMHTFAAAAAGGTLVWVARHTVVEHAAHAVDDGGERKILTVAVTQTATGERDMEGLHQVDVAALPVQAVVAGACQHTAYLLRQPALCFASKRFVVGFNHGFNSFR